MTTTEGPIQPGDRSHPDSVAGEIDRLLLVTRGQISDVAELVQAGVQDAIEITARGAAANPGATRNLLVTIRAIREAEIPTAPSRARQALGAARSFRRQHADALTKAADEHLARVISALESAVADPVEVEREEEEVRTRSAELEEQLQSRGGVYVFTFPHYLMHPTVEGTQRTLLKVGYTDRSAADRVKGQVKGAWVPEEPVVLRVYYRADLLPRDLERAFHLLLKSADHEPGKVKPRGNEWFETSLDFLDAIARVMGLDVIAV